MKYIINIDWYEDTIGEMGRLCVISKYSETYDDALNFLLREANKYTKEATIYKDGILLFKLENMFDPNP